MLQPSLASHTLCRRGQVSEVCGLEWRDTKGREDGAGQLTIFGKGGKTRMVLMSAYTWQEVMGLKGEV